MICSICLEDIKFLYFKNDCNCKIYYHLNCIEELYIYRKKCIICNKKFNKRFNNLIRKKKKVYELFVYIFIILVIVIYYISNIFVIYL